MLLDRLVSLSYAPFRAADYAKSGNPRPPGCPLRADIVAKVFLGWRTKILRAADAFYARRREGPCCFIQKSITDLRTGVETRRSGREEDQLSRDFPGRSIFDFCNNICQQQTFL